MNKNRNERRDQTQPRIAPLLRDIGQIELPRQRPLPHERSQVLPKAALNPSLFTHRFNYRSWLASQILKGKQIKGGSGFHIVTFKVRASSGNSLLAGAVRTSDLLC